MTGQDLERLEQVLAAFGSDPARWPAADRARLSAIMAQSEAARRLVAEAAALDQLMDAGADRAPAESEARVRGRLFAALEAETAPGAAADNVVPFQRPAVAAAARKVPAAAASRSVWREAMLLAAALMLGIFAGTQGILEQSGVAIPGLTDGVASRDDVSELALGMEGLGAETFGGVGMTDGEEDLL